MTTAPPPVIVGRYQLIRPLGQGGMGTVWEGHDTVLDRPIAVKEVILPPGIGDEQRAELIERATREARTAARINHRGIIAIYDAVQQDGRPWIVMELVPSRSLDQVLAENGPLPAARAAEIGREVLSALTCAHAAGVIHRDVKPANILVGRDGRIVLTDFGIATFEEDPSLTRTGMVTGSPSFIAPERVSGAQAGPASDLWSLGATLYALVTGRSPFHRDSGMAVLAALISNEQADLTRVPPEIRPALAGLLVKDPAYRVGPEEADRLLAAAASGVVPGGPVPSGARPGGPLMDSPVGGAVAPDHDRSWQEPTRPVHDRSSGRKRRSRTARESVRDRLRGRMPDRWPSRTATLIAAVTLLGVAAGGWFLLQGEKADQTEGAGNRPAAVSAPPRTLALRSFSSDQGWSIQAPKAWKNDRNDYGQQWWSDPKGRAVLSIEVGEVEDGEADPMGYLEKMDRDFEAEGTKYERANLARVPVSVGEAAELEFTGFTATPSSEIVELKGGYRQVTRVISTGASLCFLHWQVREQYWDTFQPTMRAVFRSFITPS
ncbi:serine/threonine-protein kinase [Microtetraspora sp. NBRC 16547]|uniref:serine/threonine-protein kinase n=1 Tax=Microtetraspora sp. NBRC 16547 TaxID=3030993 RepID=UPI002556E351|nr:serine/threonine-protein kinase [Microtetraspora sp. NBRC 16547]